MPAGDKQLKPIDLRWFIFHRGPLIAVAGLIVFALLTPLLLWQASPTYRAESQLMVTPVKQPTLQGRDQDAIPGDLRDYMRTLSNRILGYNTLLSAIERLPESDRPSFLKHDADPQKNVYRLMSRLEASEVPGTYLLQLSIEAGSPNHLGTTLNAVADAFLEQLGREQELKYARRLAYLNEERDRIVAQIETGRRELVQLAESAGQSAFLHKTYDTHLEKLKLLQEAYWVIETDRVEKQRTLDTVMLENEKLGALDLSSVAEKRVADNFGINRMEQWTYESLQELRSTIDGLTAENPERQYVEMRMEAMEDYLASYKTMVHSNTVDMLDEERHLEMDQTLIKAQAAAEAAARAAGHLKEEQSRAEHEASDISSVIFNAQEMLFNIEQLQTRLAALDSHIDDTQLQAKAPLPMHVDREAHNPEAPFASNTKKLLILAFALSFGFIGFICFLFDFLDNRIRTRSDIERLIGGAIPESIPRGCTAAPEVIRAYRRLAARLHREKKPDLGSVYCITGTAEQVGTTTVTRQLAGCFAEQGARAVVVDLNRSEPSGGSAETDSWPAAIWHDPDLDIDLLDALRLPASALCAARLVELLDELRAQYEWVLVDCAPMRTDETAQIAVQQADASIMVVMEDRSIYGHLLSTKQLLELYQVPAMTALLVGARPQEGTWLFNTMQSALNMISELHSRLQRCRSRAVMKARACREDA